MFHYEFIFKTINWVLETSPLKEESILALAGVNLGPEALSKEL